MGSWCLSFNLLQHPSWGRILSKRRPPTCTEWIPILCRPGLEIGLWGTYDALISLELPFQHWPSGVRLTHIGWYIEYTEHKQWWELEVASLSHTGAPKEGNQGHLSLAFFPNFLISFLDLIAKIRKQKCSLYILR